ncbi:MAG: hypothetical protein QME96_13345 [Myxococcota bacterium]|nr:hypothetical protein [Myxococcota bacterium]
MKQLSKYLFERISLDFSGTDLEEVRAMLREEDTQESRAILAKLIEDHGLEDLELTVLDCLKDELRSGVNEDVIEQHLLTYSES